MKKAKIKCRLCGYEFKVPIEEDVGHPVGPKICPNCGAEIEWIDKARGIWSCPKCGACPAGLEFE